MYAALAYTVRDYLGDRCSIPSRVLAELAQVRVLLICEYLPGRQITQNLLYTGTTDLGDQALAELGLSDLDQILELEPEPALGNGDSDDWLRVTWIHWRRSIFPASPTHSL